MSNLSPDPSSISTRAVVSENYSLHSNQASFIQSFDVKANHQTSARKGSSSSASFSPAERVLNYISGNSTELTDVPGSVIDQSEVLKHLLMSKTNNLLETSSSGIISNQQSGNYLRSSLSVGAADGNNLLRTRGQEDNSNNSNSLYWASKLTSKSSSSGSVYSNPIDNLTATSGYSSSSASTPHALRTFLHPSVGDVGRHGLSSSVVADHERLLKLGGPPVADIIAPLSSTYSQYLDTPQHPSPSEPASDNVTPLTSRGRSMGSRNTRRDLSLGPEFNRIVAGQSSDSKADTKDATNKNETNPKQTDRSLEKSPLSQSQPDLSKISSINNNAKDSQTSLRNISLSQRLSPNEMPKFVDILFNENTALRLELEVYARKVSKLQRFESEILKISAAHENLVQMCSRREQLEKLARTKLQASVQALTKANNDLRDQLNRSSEANVGATSPTEVEDSMRRELNKRDVIIGQLVAQNKELLNAKERLEMEVAAQRHTLLGQRKHIDVLDSALTSAQSNTFKLQEKVNQNSSISKNAFKNCFRNYFQYFLQKLL